jgi:hypothetical protein
MWVEKKLRPANGAQWFSFALREARVAHVSVGSKVTERFINTRSRLQIHKQKVLAELKEVSKQIKVASEGIVLRVSKMGIFAISAGEFQVFSAQEFETHIRIRL